MQDKITDDRLRRLQDSLGYALVRVFRQVNRAANRTLRRFGLSAEQAHILLLLWLRGPLKVGELQRLLTLSSATLTGALDRMERAGHVRRVADHGDGRAWRVEPTDAIAPRARREIEEALASIEERCFAALTGPERRELLKMFEKISRSLAE